MTGHTHVTLHRLTPESIQPNGTSDGSKRGCKLKKAAETAFKHRPASRTAGLKAWQKPAESYVR